MTEWEAFDAGWMLAAQWAKREDLLADMDSRAYLLERAEVLKQSATKVHRACARHQNQPITFIAHASPAVEVCMQCEQESPAK